MCAFWEVLVLLLLLLHIHELLAHSQIVFEQKRLFLENLFRDRPEMRFLNIFRFRSSELIMALP